MLDLRLITYHLPLTTYYLELHNNRLYTKINGQAKPVKMPAMMFLASTGRVDASNFTVDKAPLSVDNLIKQGDNASLQRRFIKKQREQKPLQVGFDPKQGGFASLQRRFLIKPVG